MNVYLFVVIDLISRERNGKWDDLNACRESRHVEKIKCSANSSGGIFTIKTATGFILELKSLDRRETPTEIIMDFANYFTSTPARYLLICFLNMPYTTLNIQIIN